MGINVTIPAVAEVVLTIAARAYEERVEQVMANRPLLDDRPSWEDEVRMAGPRLHQNDRVIASYLLTRLAAESRILDPHERTDPYAQFATELGDVRVGKAPDPEKVIAALRQDIRRGLLADRLGAVLAAIQQATGLMTGYGQESLFFAQCKLLYHALAAADRPELFLTLTSQFVELIERLPPVARVRLITLSGWSCLRGLRRHGLRSDGAQVVAAIRAVVPHTASVPPEEADAIPSVRLVLAAGALWLGSHDVAEPILTEARKALLTPDAVPSHPLRNYELARGYVEALGYTGPNPGLVALESLFRELPADKVVNTYTTAVYFSRLHLSIIEQAVASSCHLAVHPQP